MLITLSCCRCRCHLAVQLFQFATRLASETEAIFTSVERISAPVPQEPELWRAPDVAPELDRQRQLSASGGSPSAHTQAAASNSGGGQLAEGSVSQTALASLPVDRVDVSPQWPTAGRVEFVNVAVRYRAGLPLALRGVSFSVQAGHRVGKCSIKRSLAQRCRGPINHYRQRHCFVAGVVGRTGSGKSTLGLSLFRVIPLAGGHIVIDGVDTGAIPAAQLRSRMAVIPQDPVLFSGTIRRNLDPFDEYNDEQCWRALELVRALLSVLWVSVFSCRDGCFCCRCRWI